MGLSLSNWFTMTTGTIFNIQKYSLHDGPGIRTTVFLKGCPLKCQWCHNPESQDPRPELIYWESRCLGCGACARACPEALSSGASDTTSFSRPVHCYQMIAANPAPPGIHNRSRCTSCGKCVSACVPAAREIAGKTVTAAAVMTDILRDRVFYDQSGGGATFSGGEPLMQPAFLREMLEACREEGLGTTLDTSGFAPWDALEQLVPLVDLFLYDVKVMDDRKHVQYTGGSNGVILENLKRLAGALPGGGSGTGGRSGSPRLHARIPLVPGVNDDDDNIRCTGDYLRECGVGEVSVLPYHNLGADKYRRLGREYLLPGLAPPPDDLISHVVDLLRGFGLTVKVGG